MITLLVGAVVIIAVFIVWAGQPTYSVAYSGLSEADAGEIVQQLKDQGIQYRLKDGSTILVPADKVYDIRLAMAQEGLPKSSSVGFELFDASALIMTEFTQEVNYQRALEGELERTISSLSTVDTARVHIVIPEDALLIDEQDPTKASITLHMDDGQYINQAQVRSITHLVASSVDGLFPEFVVVIDSEGNLLAGGDIDGEMAIVSQTDAQRAAEVTAARHIEKNVEDLLEQVLGPNKSVVKASMTMNWDQRETTTESFDPEEATLRSSQVIEESYTTTESGEGVPGAEANLPEGAVVVGEEGQLYSYDRTEQTQNYEITQSNVHAVEAPGEIEWISLSVMVDGVDDEEQLATLQEAVSAAAGISLERGDVISVDTLEFDRTFLDEQAAVAQQDDRWDLYFRIAEIVIPAIIIVVLLIFLWRLFKNLRMTSGEVWTPVMQPVTEAALAASVSGRGPAMIGPGELEEGEMGLGEPLDKLAELEALEQLEMEEEIVALPPLPEIKPTVTPQDEQLIRILTRLAEDEPATVAEIIQLWLSEDES